MTTQMKTIEQYFPMVLILTLNRMALSFESVDEILKSDIMKRMRSTVLCNGAAFVLLRSTIFLWGLKGLPSAAHIEHV